MPRPSLLLFRASVAEDPFVAVFESAGWDVCCEPVLDFSFVNEDVLRDRVEQQENVEGMILTSPRAALVLANLCKESKSARAVCERYPIICTGKRTASPLQAIGLNPEMPAQADARGVAQHVIAKNPKRNWLFLCGNLRRPELPALLNEAGVSCKELEVYHTLPKSALTLDPEAPPSWVAFFSPSGVDVVHQHWPNSWQHVKKAAIGSTTAGALAAIGWQADATAAQPEAVALLAAITS